MDTGLFRLSISSLVNFGSQCFSSIYFVYVVKLIGITLPIIFSYHICKICGKVTSLIPEFGILYFYSFCSGQSILKFVSFITSSKKLFLVSLIFFYHISVYISLIYSISFYSILRLILVYHQYYKFPPKYCFSSVPQISVCCVFIFICLTFYFLNPGYREMCLVSKYLMIFQKSFCY